MDGKAAAAAQLQQQLQQEQQHAAEQKSWPRRLRGLLSFLACLLVAVNFAHTTYRVRHDPHDLAFVAAAYAMLALLFFCITKFEKLTAADCPAESKTRERLKLYVWALSTALIAMFSARIAPIMPPPLNLVILAMALLVTVGGFSLLFLCDAGTGSSMEALHKASDRQEKV